MTDLPQRKSQFLEDQNAVESWQKPSRIITVAGVAVDIGRLEQSHLAIKAQRLDRYLAQLGKISDPKHLDPPWLMKKRLECLRLQFTVSPGGRVNRNMCYSSPDRMSKWTLAMRHYCEAVGIPPARTETFTSIIMAICRNA